MSVERGKSIDFDVHNEPWLSYELNDNTKIKTRYILTRLYRKTQEDNKRYYNFDGQTMTVAIIPPENMGPKDEKIYSPDEMKNSIIQDDVQYKSRSSEDWNDYTAHDGSRIRLKMMVTGIKKTSLYDKNGEPVYLVENTAMIQVREPTVD